MVTVLVPALAISTTAGVSTTTPGGTVPYTSRCPTPGRPPTPAATVTIALAGALDDATYDGATATAGTVAYNAGTGVLVWTGNLAVGAVVTVTGSVTVNNPDPGNKTVTVVATSAAAGSTCPAGSSNPGVHHHVQVLVPQLTITSAADASSTTPGSVVTYTFSVTNTGQTAYIGCRHRGRAGRRPRRRDLQRRRHRHGGRRRYASPTLTWTGDLAIGASVNVTYSVTVNDPDPGDHAADGQRSPRRPPGATAQPAAPTPAASATSPC